MSPNANNLDKKAIFEECMKVIFSPDFKWENFFRKYLTASQVQSVLLVRADEYFKLVSRVIEVMLDYYSLEGRLSTIFLARKGIGNGQIYTLAVLGDYFKISRERVRQLEYKAIQRLKIKVRRLELEEAMLLFMVDFLPTELPSLRKTIISDFSDERAKYLSFGYNKETKKIISPRLLQTDYRDFNDFCSYHTGKGKRLSRSFDLYRNSYLKRNVKGYFHQYYTGYEKPGNPDFVNILKNTFNSESYKKLIEAQNMVISILIKDISAILIELNMPNCLCVCVPRAKTLETYSKSQQMFREAVSIASNKISGTFDGTAYIRRRKNTLTTHLSHSKKIISEKNDGRAPYPGITNETCWINKEKINNQDIILIDDIYTKTINIDEDCIQALFDNGAKNIIFYAIGYTRSR